MNNGLDQEDIQMPILGHTDEPPGEEEEMESQTIFLDEGDVRRGRLYWGFQFALWIVVVFWGVRGLSDPDKKVLSMILLICAGLMLVALAFIKIFMSNPNRRPRIIFQEDGLAVKRSLYREAQEIAWDEISSVDLKPNAIEILLKDPEREKIRFEMQSYAVNQKMKDHFRTYVAGKLEVPADSLPEQRF